MAKYGNVRADQLQVLQHYECMGFLLGFALRIYNIIHLKFEGDAIYLIHFYQIQAGFQCAYIAHNNSSNLDFYFSGLRKHTTQ